MMENIVSSIICDEFDKNIKRGQIQEEKPKAMLLTFSLSSNYEIEEGYRHLDLLIYGHANYVAVMARERWNVISMTEIEANRHCDKNSEMKKYTKGDTGWKLVSYHDSCWRDGVHRIISNNSDRISTIEWLFGGWSQSIDMSPNLFKIYQKLTRSSDQEDRYENRYEMGKGVFKFEG